MDLQLPRHQMLLYWAGTPNQHRPKQPPGTAGCAVALNNRNFLVGTAGVLGSPDMAASRARTGFTASAQRYLPTVFSIWKRTPTV